MFKKLTNKLKFKSNDDNQKEMPEKLILIVGCYNSGTTVLNHILSKHEEISGLDTEGVALTKELKTPEDFGWNRLWYKCQDKLEISKLPKSPNVEQIKKDWARYFDSNKSFALEKSIINGLNIDWFEQQFNHPYFIFIVRNGYTVAEGIRRRTLNKKRNGFKPGEPYPIKWCAEQWVISNKLISKKLSNVKNSYQLLYENLMDNYDQTIQKLLEWLPLQSKILEKPDSFRFHQQTRAIKNMNYSSLKNLKIDDIKKINSIAKDYLKYWGYEILSDTVD
jgi:hypothetical protein